MCSISSNTFDIHVDVVGMEEEDELYKEVELDH